MQAPSATKVGRAGAELEIRGPRQKRSCGRSRKGQPDPGCPWTVGSGPAKPTWRPG